MGGGVGCAVIDVVELLEGQALYFVEQEDECVAVLDVGQRSNWAVAEKRGPFEQTVFGLLFHC